MIRTTITMVRGNGNSNGNNDNINNNNSNNSNNNNNNNNNNKDDHNGNPTLHSLSWLQLKEKQRHASFLLFTYGSGFKCKFWKSKSKIFIY